jgi:hypothetical protein
MSSTLPPPPPPPAGPPSGPPSGPPGPPPSGPPEFLQSGGGDPVPPEPRRSSGLKRGLLVGGGVVGLGAVAVGAWAAYGFFSTGPQPAEALPAATLGYASIDLDPSGGQKIEALRTLNKFPAFKDKVGINPDDDLRKELFDKIQEGAGCADLDWDDDIEPWLGDRAAVAAVDLGKDEPSPVVVVQVKDADQADAGLDKIKDCGGGDLGWEVDGDWAVLAETDDIAADVVKATADGSLADDEDFQRWTDEAGDPGVVSLYAGPEAGDYFADHADDLFGLGGLGDVACGVTEGLVPGATSSDDDGTDDYGSYDDGYGSGCADVDPSASAVSDDLKEQLRDFQGMAITVRFDDGAVEMESAGDSSVPALTMLSGGGTADVVKSLPADTGAVLGVGFADGWFGDLVDYLAPYVGSESSDELMSELSDATGLDLPGDAEALAGDSAALVLGSDFDPSTAFASDDGSDVPIALKIQGDADEIQGVLDKLREMAGPDDYVLDSDADGDTVVVGPNADFRKEVLGDGGLGDDDVFKDVIREADDASAIVFVNVNEFEDALQDAMGDGDEEFLDNIKPVSGIGAESWVDDDVAHGIVRITTD